MRSYVLHRVLLVAALLPALTGCAFGAYIAANTPLERAINGTYEGVGVGGTGRVPYRLILSVQEREGRASGVITNLESHKAYAVSGKFQRAGEGGTLDVNLYENGDKWRGTLRGEIAGMKLSGTLRTVLLGKELLGYVVNLEKQPEGNLPVSLPVSPALAVP
ncbi:hypothetical protein [Deinococcus sp. DB0503]|uniref:hypothetical protein n=1 Tax=Deinococcus sp. DB0503 TaxID=2479203 RepID=UPI0018DF6155|nr:hypothetical protein [Deinococcus sp. DB0503]MBI0447219.1 hypothetical protein [Deinococcus sp. DB0503]